MLVRGSANGVSLIKKVLHAFPRGKVIHHARLKPSTVQCKQCVRLGGTVYGNPGMTHTLNIGLQRGICNNCAEL